MLLDSCGHERCYSCLFLSEDCPLCRRGEILSKSKLNLKLKSYQHLSEGAPARTLSLGRQQDLYTSLKNLHHRRSPTTSIRSRPPSPSPSLVCTHPIDPSCLYGSVSGRTPLTPPITRRSDYNPSPARPRRNWVQRYNRRPNTVNIDENTMAGNCHKNKSKL